MHLYHVYGLNVESDIELPGMTQSRGEIDVVFRLGRIPNKPAIADKKFMANWSTRDEACLSYKHIATFLMRHGKEIIIEPEDESDLHEVGQILLGVAISVILYQRGLLVLHCSVIDVGGYAIAFLGHSGYGKSSLASAFYEKGYKLISDDLGVIDYDNINKAVVYSGFAQVKLWSDSLENMGIRPDALPQISQNYNKRTRILTNQFVDESSIPLKCLYVLQEGEDTAISEITGYQSIIELINFTFDIALIELTDGLANHFAQCTQLATAVPIKRLERPWDFSKIPDVVRLIEADFERLSN